MKKILMYGHTTFKGHVLRHDEKGIFGIPFKRLLNCGLGAGALFTLLRVTWTGTNQDDVHDMAASGKTVRFAGVEIYRIMNGKIAEIWHHTDTAGVSQQIRASQPLLNNLPNQ